MLIAGLTTGVANAETRETVDEGWVVKIPNSLGTQGVQFVENHTDSVSILRVRYPELRRWKGCESISAEPCGSAEIAEFSAVLQPCVGPVQVDCLVEFGVLDSAGNKIQATYANQFPSKGLND
ncbi:MAG: hypothetical protein ACKOJH_13900, partial [Actinomycetota bacterium]